MHDVSERKENLTSENRATAATFV